MCNGQTRRQRLHMAHRHRTSDSKNTNQGTGRGISIRTPSARAAGERWPGWVRRKESSYLKGVTAVSYKALNETKTKHCDIDMKAWNTSIDFVANQSTKLKFWREEVHAAELKERSGKLGFWTRANLKTWINGTEIGKNFRNSVQCQFFGSI